MIKFSSQSVGKGGQIKHFKKLPTPFWKLLLSFLSPALTTAEPGQFLSGGSIKLLVDFLQSGDTGAKKEQETGVCARDRTEEQKEKY